jgi:hypothetical protein
LEFADGDVYLGMMPDSRKLRDLERDARLAIHSPTEDPPVDDPHAWAGEAKLAGRAIEVDFPNPPVSGGRRFKVDILEVVLTRLNDRADRLVVESWQPGRGRRLLERR